MSVTNSRAQTRVIIDASSRIVFSSFYIQGLYDVLGKSNVSFSSRRFKDLGRKTAPRRRYGKYAERLAGGIQPKKRSGSC
jgi:hypothetical protein